MAKREDKKIEPNFDPYGAHQYVAAPTLDTETDKPSIFNPSPLPRVSRLAYEQQLKDKLRDAKSPEEKEKIRKELYPSVRTYKHETVKDDKGKSVTRTVEGSGKDFPVPQGVDPYDYYLYLQEERDSEKKAPATNDNYTDSERLSHYIEDRLMDKVTNMDEFTDKELDNISKASIADKALMLSNLLYEENRIELEGLKDSDRKAKNLAFKRMFGEDKFKSMPLIKDRDALYKEYTEGPEPNPYSAYLNVNTAENKEEKEQLDIAESRVDTLKKAYDTIPKDGTPLSDRQKEVVNKFQQAVQDYYSRYSFLNSYQFQNSTPSSAMETHFSLAKDVAKAEKALKADNTEENRKKRDEAVAIYNYHIAHPEYSGKGLPEGEDVGYWKLKKPAPTKAKDIRINPELEASRARMNELDASTLKASLSDVPYYISPYKVNPSNYSELTRSQEELSQIVEKNKAKKDDMKNSFNKEFDVDLDNLDEYLDRTVGKSEGGITSEGVDAVELARERARTKILKEWEDWQKFGYNKYLNNIKAVNQSGLKEHLNSVQDFETWLSNYNPTYQHFKGTKVFSSFDLETLYNETREALSKEGNEHKALENIQQSVEDSIHQSLFFASKEEKELGVYSKNRVFLRTFAGGLLEGLGTGLFDGPAYVAGMITNIGSVGDGTYWDKVRQSTMNASMFGVDALSLKSVHEFVDNFSNPQGEGQEYNRLLGDHWYNVPFSAGYTMGNMTTIGLTMAFDGAVALFGKGTSKKVARDAARKYLKEKAPNISDEALEHCLSLVEKKADLVYNKGVQALLSVESAMSEAIPEAIDAGAQFEQTAREHVQQAIDNKAQEYVNQMQNSIQTFGKDGVREFADNHNITEEDIKLEYQNLIKNTDVYTNALEAYKKQIRDYVENEHKRFTAEGIPGSSISIPSESQIEQMAKDELDKQLYMQAIANIAARQEAEASHFEEKIAYDRAQLESDVFGMQNVGIAAVESAFGLHTKTRAWRNLSKSSKASNVGRVLSVKTGKNFRPEIELNLPKGKQAAQLVIKNALDIGSECLTEAYVQGVATEGYKQLQLSNTDQFIYNHMFGDGTALVSDMIYKGFVVDRPEQSSNLFISPLFSDDIDWKQAKEDANIAEVISSTIYSMVVGGHFGVPRAMTEKGGRPVRRDNESLLRHWTKLASYYTPYHLNMMTEVQDQIEENDKVQDYADRIRRFYENPINKDALDGAKAVTNYMIKYNECVNNGDKLGAEKALTEATLAEAVMLSRMTQHEGDVSGNTAHAYVENRKQLYRNMAEIKSGTEEQKQEAINTWKKEAPDSQALSMTDEEILNHYEARGKEMLEVFDKVDKIAARIENTYGSDIDEYTRSSLIYSQYMNEWADSKLKSYEDRIRTYAQHLPDTEGEAKTITISDKDRYYYQLDFEKISEKERNRQDKAIKRIKKQLAKNTLSAKDIMNLDAETRSFLLFVLANDEDIVSAEQKEFINQIVYDNSGLGNDIAEQAAMAATYSAIAKSTSRTYSKIISDVDNYYNYAGYLNRKAVASRAVGILKNADNYEAFSNALINASDEDPELYRAIRANAEATNNPFYKEFQYNNGELTHKIGKEFDTKMSEWLREEGTPDYSEGQVTTVVSAIATVLKLEEGKPNEWVSEIKSGIAEILPNIEEENREAIKEIADKAVSILEDIIKSHMPNSYKPLTATEKSASPAIDTDVKPESQPTDADDIVVEPDESGATLEDMLGNEPSPASTATPPQPDTVDKEKGDTSDTPSGNLSEHQVNEILEEGNDEPKDKYDHKEPYYKAITQNQLDSLINDLSSETSEFLQNLVSDSNRAETIRQLAQQVLDSRASRDLEIENVDAVEPTAKEPQKDTNGNPITLTSNRVSEYEYTEFTKGSDHRRTARAVPNSKLHLGKVIGLLQKLGAFDFVNKGNLAKIILANPDTKIRFLTNYDYNIDNERGSERVVYLAIEYDNAAPGNPVINGKSYQIVGTLAYRGVDSKADKTGWLRRMIDDNNATQGTGDSSNWVLYSENVSTKVQAMYSGMMVKATEADPNPVVKDIDSQFMGNTELALGWWYDNTTFRLEGCDSDLAERPNSKSDTSNRAGSVWLMFRGGDGKYWPHALTVKHFDETEYPIATYGNTPFYNYIKNQLAVIVDSSKSVRDRTIAVGNINNMLYFKDRNEDGEASYRILFNGDSVSVVNTKNSNASYLDITKNASTIEDKVNAVLNTLSSDRLTIRISVNPNLWGRQISYTDNSGKNHVLSYKDFLLQSGVMKTDLAMPQHVNATFSVYTAEAMNTSDKTSTPTLAQPLKTWASEEPRRDVVVKINGSNYNTNGVEAVNTSGTYSEETVALIREYFNAVSKGLIKGEGDVFQFSNGTCILMTGDNAFHIIPEEEYNKTIKERNAKLEEDKSVSVADLLLDNDPGKPIAEAPKPKEVTPQNSTDTKANTNTTKSNNTLEVENEKKNNLLVGGKKKVLKLLEDKAANMDAKEVEGYRDRINNCTDINELKEIRNNLQNCK